jgi:4-hydroxy-2-oxoglutarate aldolase
MDNSTISGAFAPIPTPFDDSGAVDHANLAANIAKWAETPLSGLLVLGSNGEFTFLSDQEKLEVLKTARQAIPDNKVFLAGTGCDSTRNTIELTRQATEIGADAALVLTPCYYTGKMDAQAMRRHYLEVAEQASIPILIYNMPACTGVDLAPQTVLELAQHPNIVGIKDSSGNITKMGTILRDAPKGFRVLAGSASFLYASLALGAAGGIMALGNIAPEACAQLYDYAQEGNHDMARQLQLKLINANTAVTATFGVAGLKQAMDWLGYYGGPCRSPLGPLSAQQQDALRTILIDADIIK